MKVLNGFEDRKTIGVDHGGVTIYIYIYISTENTLYVYIRIYIYGDTCTACTPHSKINGVLTSRSLFSSSV